MEKMKLISVLGLIVAVIALAAADAHASYYDWSDAPGYGDAWNRGDGPTSPIQWYGPTWTSEAGPLANDPSDDGISWSTDGAYYGHESVILGQTIWFKLEAHETTWNSWTDYIRMWVDWNGNNVFDMSELTVSHDWIDGHPNNNLTLIVPYVVPLDAAVGTTWLRARIACGTAGCYRFPYGNTSQGECEDWPIEITTTEIPEPTSMLLFGIGLAGIATRKFRNKRLNHA